MSEYNLFVDLDGVLADFDTAVAAVCGRPPSELSPGEMWPRLARTPNFYANLPWMPDGRQLWETVRPLDPRILTGLPRGNWAEPQKRLWCRRELGPDVPVVTCMSREKYFQADLSVRNGRIPVLVDDSIRLAADWMDAGGIFIHHLSTRETLQELQRRLPDLFTR